MKDIIIFNEKYGDRYFDASTEELKFAACLKILKERLKDGWYNPCGEKPSDKNILSEEQISQLPTENLKIQESRKRKDYLRELREHEEEITFFNNVKTSLSTKDGKLAYHLLLQRDGGSYEGFNIEKLEET